MIELTIPAYELFNEKTNEFIEFKGRTIQLEHSLISISKWESRWNKPFFGSEKHTGEEVLDYIKCMTINKGVPDTAYLYLSDKQYADILDYIAAPMTATVITDRNENKNNRREILTSEVIYYYMIACNIPIECERWHINRLFTLIKVCGIKNDTNPKKQSKRETLANNAALNAARRKKMNSKG